MVPQDVPGPPQRLLSDLSHAVLLQAHASQPNVIKQCLLHNTYRVPRKACAPRPRRF